MDNNLNEFVAARIRSFRKGAGLTQAELAERIERTTEAVSNVERAKSLPSIETVIALSEVLNTPIRDFFPESNSERKVSANRLAKESDAMAQLLSLTDKQLDVALAQIIALRGL